jgi:hypothetical protein
MLAFCFCSSVYRRKPLILQEKVIARRELNGIFEKEAHAVAEGEEKSEILRDSLHGLEWLFSILP